MASVVKEIRVPAPAEEVWAALRDVGALHRRLVPGFVIDTTLEDDTRTVTFAGGVVARERIVGVDETARRVAYTIVDGVAGCTHHHASAQVLPDGDGSRFVWITDVLPDGMAAPLGAAMDRGLEAIAATFA